MSIVQSSIVQSVNVRSFNVQSCNVHPCEVVRQCPVLTCPPLRTRPSLSSLAISNPVFYSSVNVQSCNFSQPLGPVVIMFVRPSVRLSVRHTRALWQNQTMHCGNFDTTRKGNNSSLLTLTVVGGPLPSQMCAQSDPLPSKNADFDRFPIITSQSLEIAKKFNYNE